MNDLSTVGEFLCEDVLGKKASFTLDENAFISTFFSGTLDGTAIINDISVLSFGIPLGTCEEQFVGDPPLYSFRDYNEVFNFKLLFNGEIDGVAVNDINIDFTGLTETTEIGGVKREQIKQASMSFPGNQGVTGYLRVTNDEDAEWFFEGNYEGNLQLS